MPAIGVIHGEKRRFGRTIPTKSWPYGVVDAGMMLCGVRGMVLGEACQRFPRQCKALRRRVICKNRQAPRSVSAEQRAISRPVEIDPRPNRPPSRLPSGPADHCRQRAGLAAS